MPPDRPRLWESVRRALGGAPTEGPADPEPVHDLVPPFLAPDDTGTVAAAPASARSEAVDRMPAPRAESEPAPPEPAPSAPDPPASRSPRLARGLASFSRNNADREKKFRHILSDGDSARKK